MKNFFILASVFYGFIASANNFADKNYYLIDSLKVKDLSFSDRKLLDSALTYYHNSNTVEDKANCLSSLASTLKSDKSLEYNLLLENLVLSKITKNNSDNFWKVKQAEIDANYGGYWKNKGNNMAQAIQHYKTSLETYGELDHLAGAVECKLNLAGIWVKLEHYEEAIGIYSEIKEVYMAKNMESDLSPTLERLAGVYALTRNYDKARQYYLKSIEIERKLRRKQNLPRLLRSVAGVSYANRNLEESINYYLESLEISRSLTSTTEVVSSLFDLANLYKTEGDLIQARKFFVQILDFQNGATKEPTLYGDALISLGNIALGQNEVDLANEYGNEALLHGEQYANAKHIRDAAKLLHLTSRELKDVDKSWDMMQLYAAMNDTVLRNQFATKAEKINLAMRYERDMAKLDSGNHQKDNSSGQKEPQSPALLPIGSVLFALIILCGLLYLKVIKLPLLGRTVILILNLVAFSELVVLLVQLNLGQLAGNSNSEWIIRLLVVAVLSPLYFYVQKRFQSRLHDQNHG